ncbi:hypothetical protein HYP58_gp11 [Vibrio phage 1.097.O._10N.286.49.B3]|uniref:Coil containing protein n=1 Tax=Vibrio phage 1.097.O._10N.286.49.B3 TaxID=1881383 RepID=A0A2I7R0H8_9CAUD|nr:hypothetical protein HYP58_gp11 [Vibrio phage 1.097.O._10N.286.49.B3]AUR87157.1 hypothetical protein NVP1097O_11 [Vibrio phage 1.097.O._10N.286.49.B3]
MGINSGSPTAIVGRYINTAYDNVKLVADNIDVVIEVGDNLDNSLKYLGAATVAPTERLDGNPIEDGDYFFDTNLNGLTYYKALDSTWFTIDPSVVLDAADAAVQAATDSSDSATASTEQAVISTAQAVIATEQATISTEQAVLAAASAQYAEDVSLNDLEAITRSLNILDSDIIYDTDTVTPIPSYIYSVSQQKTYSVPAGAIGKTIVSVVGDVLETSGGSYTLNMVVTGRVNKSESEIVAGTPAVGEMWFNTTDSTIHMGDGITLGGIKYLNESTAKVVYKKVGADSAVQNMIDGLPAVAKEGDTVSTGNTDWKIVANQPNTFVQLDSGLYAIPLNGVHVDDFGATAYDGDWTVDTESRVDSTEMVNQALDTGGTVVLGYGTYLFTDELLMFTLGQTMRGQGGGKYEGGINYKLRSGWKTRLFFHGSPTKYTKTRRNARSSSSDPVDTPTAVGVNIQQEQVTLQGVFVDLSCDYTNASPSNLGADYDVGINIGCRLSSALLNVNVRGYWRQAGVLLDVTRLGSIGEFSTPGGREYPSTGANGADKCRIDRCVFGGQKGLFVAGPIKNGLGTYYDDVAGLVSDGRGGYGASDLLATQSYFYGRDHHSGYRAYDAPIDSGTGTLNPELVDVNMLSAPLVIDASRGSDSQPRVRRLKFDACRFVTIEAARIFIDRAHEVVFDFPTTESLSGTVYSTGGAVVDQYDYYISSFKDIACKPTDWDGAGTGATRISFLESAGFPFSRYFEDVVYQYRLTITGRQEPEEQEQTAELSFLFGGGSEVFTTNRLIYMSSGTLTTMSVAIAFSGVDTADLSTVTLTAPIKVGDNGILNIDPVKSTALNFSDGDEYRMRVIDTATYLRLEIDKNGSPITYHSGDINESGSIVACGIASDSGFS